jgi:hypothetical protein
LRATASRAWLATLLGPLTLSACITPAVPELSPVYGEEARVAAWMATARESGAARRSLRALAALRLDSPSGSGTLREVILIERPSRLRLETLNLLGQTQAVLVTNGERFGFYDGGEFEAGPVEPGLLRERLGLDLRPDEAVRVLLAAPALTREPPEMVYAQGADRIVQFPRQRVRFAADGDLRAVESLDERGEVRWVAEYHGWRDVDGGRYPFVMQLRFPGSRVHAELELDSVELNPALAAELFTLSRAAED